ncbi:MAG: MFS transporter [Thermoplasmataceae archaeon]
MFILIMYLQGILGFSPLYSSLILVPGYIVSSFFSPMMGKMSDRIGPRVVASAGIFFMAGGVLVYLLLTATSSIYIVVAGSIITGFGGSMFWPSNNSAVMSAAPRELYGSISGLLRTLSNIGTLFNYVIAISIAAISVPRYVAFEVFLGVTKLQGGVSQKFLTGIHAALLASFTILIFAGLSSLVRGKHDMEKVSESWIQGDKTSKDFTDK